MMACLAIVDLSHKQYSQLVPPSHKQDCLQVVFVEEEEEVLVLVEVEVSLCV